MSIREPLLPILLPIVGLVGCAGESNVRPDMNDDAANSATDDAPDSSTDDRSDSFDDVAADTFAEDNCDVVGDTVCSQGCVPVYSDSDSGIPCAIAGVFFGCIPASDSSFWMRYDGEAVPAQYGVCDLLKTETERNIYCFVGNKALYWFYSHRELWCQGECHDGRSTTCF